MISYIDNASNHILFHINIWFGIELMNLLLVSYTPKPVVRNGTTTQPITSAAKTWKIIEGKEFR
jgi:hypothetical protein